MEQFYGFFMALSLVLVTMGTFAQNDPERKIINFHELPFIETWDQGTFNNNNWVLEPANTNWTINTNVGNPLPSADFKPDSIRLDYSLSLETPSLYSWFYTCAKIWCDFDYKLISLNGTGEEKLFVDLFSGGEWTNMTSFSNTEDKDWTHMHVCLTEGSDTPIKIRFRAEGANSADILHWYLDNIMIYVRYNPPADLAIKDIADRQVTLTWNPPECGTEDPGSFWIHWDDGINYNAIGTCPTCCFDIAARWDTSQIKALDGGAVTKIAFFPCSSGEANYRVRVYKGPGADKLLISQQVQSLIYDEWNIIELTNPVAVDVTQDLWIGCNIELIGGWPMGVDAGPAADGFGNLVYWTDHWETLYSFGLNYNWNIEAYIEPAKGNVAGNKAISQYRCDTQGNLSASPVPVTRKSATPGSIIIAATSSIQGYNVWRSDDDKVTYNKLNVNLLTDTNYVDTVPGYQEYFYKVTAIFQPYGSMTCDSDSSNIVCAEVLSGIDNLDGSRISIHPNPARENIVVSSDVSISGIELFNFTGQPVLARQNISEKTVMVNVSVLESGVYLIRITTEREISIIKITIAH